MTQSSRRTASSAIRAFPASRQPADRQLALTASALRNGRRPVEPPRGETAALVNFELGSSAPIAPRPPRVVRPPPLLSDQFLPEDRDIREVRTALVETIASNEEIGRPISIATAIAWARSAGQIAPRNPKIISNIPHGSAPKSSRQEKYVLHILSCILFAWRIRYSN